MEGRVFCQIISEQSLICLVIHLVGDLGEVDQIFAE